MHAEALSARIVVVDADAGRAGLCAEAISTHAPGTFAQPVGPGAADLADRLAECAGAVCVCDDPVLPLEVIRSVRGAGQEGALVAIVPADRPGLADEALAAGATDVLLRSPGYLEQLPLVVRAAVVRSRSRASEDRRAREIELEMRALRDELAEALQRADRLESLAQTDALTGLGNRRALEARLSEQFSASCRHDVDLSVLQIDLDALKSVNDGLGHAAGDQLLCIAARAIGATLRKSDFAARVGGDEFVVILPHTDAGRAKLAAERVLAEFALGSAGMRARLEEHRRRTGVIHVLGPRSAGRRECDIGMSIGVASRRLSAAATPGLLLALADQALYAAKQSPGSVRVHQPVQVMGSTPQAA